MTTELEHALAHSLAERDSLRTSQGYWRHDELLVLDAALPQAWLSQMQREVLALQARVKRKSIWGYKSAGSLAHGVLADQAPTVLALYHSKALIHWLSALAEVPLRVCPGTDPHACAVYWYDRPGDRIGYHYDTSLYRGARYTLLLGLFDESSSRLVCRVHARDRHRDTLELAVQTTPGKLVFFNGDKLLHGVSPLQPGERRVVLSMQLVTDPHMDAIPKLVSSAKDAFAYFGRDAFRLPRRVPA